jgi:putative ABC transport system permease protein
MSMSVLERTGEIGIMRAMGMSRPRGLGLFLVESIFIGLLGSAVGVLLGSAGAWYLETYGVTLGEDVVAKMGSSFPKTSIMSEIEMVLGRPVARRMEISDQLKQNSRTVFLLEEVSFDVELESEVFTRRWLERN